MDGRKLGLGAEALRILESGPGETAETGWARARAASSGHDVTKVVTLRAGSWPVKDPFDTLIAPRDATFLLASVNQDDTLDEVLFTRVNG